MSPTPVGYHPPLKETRCHGKGCDLVLYRRNALHRAKCPACVRKTRVANDAAKAVKQREQARRYRILMHVAGFEDFTEFLAELRKSPLAFRTEPEGVQARRDFKRERIRHER